MLSHSMGYSYLGDVWKLLRKAQDVRTQITGPLLLQDIDAFLRILKFRF